MSTGLGKVQVETLRALAAIEAEAPGRGTSIRDLASLVFNTDHVDEAKRVALTRGINQLADDEKLVVRLDGATGRDRLWKINPHPPRGWGTVGELSAHERGYLW